MGKKIGEIIGGAAGTAAGFGLASAQGGSALAAGGAGAVLGYGAVAGTKAAIKARKEMFKPIKEAKALLAADVEALKKPAQLGLTQSQIQQQISTAQQAAGVQAGAAQADVARQALSGQGFQAGAFTEAQRAIQEQSQTAGTAASAQAHEMSRRIQEREANRIRAALDAQRERARQAAVATGQKALGVVGGITSALGAAGILPPGVSKAFEAVGGGISSAGGAGGGGGGTFDYDALAKAMSEQGGG